MLQPSTYGFLVRPGPEHVRRRGGVGAYLNWPGPVLTDSGCVLPLESWGRPGTPAPRIVKVDDDGLIVNSYLDGSALRITPESSIAAQIALGSTLLTTLSPSSAGRRPHVERVREWAVRARAARLDAEQRLLLHATATADLELLSELSVDGVVSDDLAVFEALADIARPATARTRDEACPAEAPFLRVWTGQCGPEDVARAVGAGVDLIGGSAAIALAGKGRGWTAAGELDLTGSTVARDPGAIEPGCTCPSCGGGYARGYIHHLFHAAELLGPTLLTMHNVHVLTTRVSRMRRDARG